MSLADHPYAPGPEAGMQLAGALWWFWVLQGHLSEGLRWLETVLAASGIAEGRARARALLGAGYLMRAQGDKGHGQTLFEKSRNLSSVLGDRGGSAEALYHLGLVAQHNLDDHARARDLYEESVSLFRAAQDGWATARVLRKLGQLAMERLDFQRATGPLEESLRIAREVGQPSGIAESLGLLGELWFCQDDVGRASPLLDESLLLVRSAGDKRVLCEVLQRAGIWACQHDDVENAQACWQESLAVGRAIGNVGFQAWSLLHLSFLALERGDAMHATAWSTESLVLSRGRMHIPDILMVLASASVATGQPIRAAQLFGAYAAMRDETGAADDPVWPASPLPAWDPEQRACRAAQASMALARAALDHERFATAWAHGVSLAVEEAIALARSPGASSTDTR
jgi:tetratricopeptide (TPR) repeat protein